MTKDLEEEFIKVAKEPIFKILDEAYKIGLVAGQQAERERILEKLPPQTEFLNKNWKNIDDISTPTLKGQTKGYNQALQEIKRIINDAHH